MILPMVSDDFWYGEKNLDLISVSIQHYINWSGRLLTDVTSRIILQYPAWVVSGIKTIALVLLIVLLANLPSMILGKKVFSRVNLYLLFITYWICNPNLGQTTFWTVGASNYLFTNLWILAYLNWVFFMFNKKNHWYEYILLVLTAFGAGLSNENTSPVIVMFTAGMLIYVIYKKNKNIAPWIVGLIFNLVGSLILLLSPGNKVRVRNLPSDVKTGLSVENIYGFFTDGTGGTLFSNYGFLFLIFIIIGIFLFYKKEVSRKAIFWSMIFILMAIVANFAFVLSPVTMVRSLQGAFVLFLISLSFMVSELMRTPRFKIINIIFSVSMILASMIFVTSYILEVNSFKLARTETNIRQSIILKAKKNNDPRVTIPSMYTGLLLRPKNDSYDTFFSPHLGQYYGYKGIIQESGIPMDYTDADNFKDKYVKVSGSKLIYGVKFIKQEDTGKITAIVLLKQLDRTANFDLVIDLKSGNKYDYNIPVSRAMDVRGNKFVSINLNPMYKDNLDNVTILVSDNGNFKNKLVLNTRDVYNML